MNIEDLGVLGDWYEDQGENGELIRNLLIILITGSDYCQITNRHGHGDFYNYHLPNNGAGNGASYEYGSLRGWGKGLGYDVGCGYAQYESDWRFRHPWRLY